MGDSNLQNLGGGGPTLAQRKLHKTLDLYARIRYMYSKERYRANGIGLLILLGQHTAGSRLLLLVEAPSVCVIRVNKTKSWVPLAIDPKVHRRSPTKALNERSSGRAAPARPRNAHVRDCGTSHTTIYATKHISARTKHKSRTRQ